MHTYYDEVRKMKKKYLVAVLMLMLFLPCLPKSAPESLFPILIQAEWAGLRQ